MRGIPFFLLVALASLGQAQPTLPENTGLKSILRCMDSPAGRDNPAEKHFVRYWKKVIQRWDKREIEPPEPMTDMISSINSCAETLDNPIIGEIGTKPWDDFFRDLVNIGATFWCVKRTPSGLEVNEECMADLKHHFKKEPRVLTKKELDALYHKSCQKNEEHLERAFWNLCAARTAHQKAIDLYPNVESQPDPAPSPAPAPTPAPVPAQQQHHTPGEQNGKVHDADRVQMSTNVEQKHTGLFFSRPLNSKIRPFLNRFRGALLKSNGPGGSAPVLPQAPVKPVVFP